MARKNLIARIFYFKNMREFIEYLINLLGVEYVNRRYAVLEFMLIFVRCFLSAVALETI